MSVPWGIGLRIPCILEQKWCSDCGGLWQEGVAKSNCNKVNKKVSNVGVVSDKSSVIIWEAWEGLDVSDSGKSGLVCDSWEFGRVHGNLPWSEYQT